MRTKEKVEKKATEKVQAPEAHEEAKKKLTWKELFSNLYSTKVTPFIKIFIRMNSYSKAHIPYLIAGYIFMLADSLIDTYTPSIIGEITDAIHQGKGYDGITEIAISLLKLMTAGSVFGLLRTFMFGKLSRKVERQMREEYFKILLNKDISFYDDSKTGEISSKLTRDVASVKTSITSDFVQIIMKVITIVSSLYFTVMISFKLTAILFLLTVPRTFLIFKYGAYIRKMKREQFKEMNKANGFAVESFMNIRVIKTFSTEDKELSKYVNKLEESQKIDDDISTKSLAYDAMKNILQNIIQVGLVWYGGYLVLEANMTIGQITRFVAYSGKLVRSINTIEGTVKKLMHSITAAEDVYDQIDTVKKTMQEKSQGITKDHLRGDITFNEVSFSYPTSKEIKIYDKLSVAIKAGESVALVGSSGSGKSTFVNLLLRLYDATEGNIMIDGDEIKTYNLKWFHSQVGYVSQEPSLFSGTLEENITYGLSTYNDQDIDEAITMANAKAFIQNKDLFPKGLETKVAERGLKLSGGQKQRIAIARALIKKPRILIFDEATSALDSQSEEQVQKAIDSILKKGDKTMIVIAHRLSTVINCSRILVFKEGKIVEEGNHESLLQANGIYSELVKTQLSSHIEAAKKVSNPMKIERKANNRKREKSPKLDDDNNFDNDDIF